MMVSITIVTASMKISIYDRLDGATTEQLLLLRALWIGMVERREKIPRHDYHGKCIIRCTQILEKRGVLPTTSPTHERR